MPQRTKALFTAVIGQALGAAAGWLVGWLAQSDNAPFFVVLGALAGLWGGLAYARVVRPLVLGGIGLTALLLAVVFAPRAPIQTPAPLPTALASPTPRADGLTADQAATLSSLRKVDDYPLYTMNYVRGAGSPVSDGNSQTIRNRSFSRLLASRGRVPDRSTAGVPQPRFQNAAAADATNPPAWACSLFAALGDPSNRLYGRNFDWRYSPALLLYADRPAAGGYASVSMVDIAYSGFDDMRVDLTTLPLAARRGLLEALDWPFDGMNEAGVAVGMAAVPQADARRDPGKPSIDSLSVMREILDRAGSVGEAVAIFSSYNIDWEGGPPLHYLVADRTGSAALVEFHSSRIAVLPNAGPWHAATNFTLSAVADPAGQCHRYDAVVQRLMAADGQLTPADALDLLRAVAQTESATQWSVVYGMNTGQVEVVMGQSYRRVYAFQLKRSQGTQ